MCTSSGYQLHDVVTALGLCSSSCCNTKHVYYVKPGLYPEEIVVFTFTLVPFVGVSTLHVSVIDMAQTEACLPADLPYFNLNCSSNVSHSINSHADAG